MSETEETETISTEGFVGRNPRIKETRVQIADIVQKYTELDWYNKKQVKN